MTDIKSRTVVNAQDLDAAIEHARAALAALLPGGFNPTDEIICPPTAKIR